MDTNTFEMALACSSQLKLFVGSSNAVILDTETTGLGDNAEIVEIAIINTTGKVLFHSLVMPVGDIEPEAAAVHGITKEVLENAPSWMDIREKVFDVLKGKVVGIYNAEYDLRLIEQTDTIAINRAMLDCEISEIDRIGYSQQSSSALNDIYASSVCLMNLYAGYFGEIKEGKDCTDLSNYRWQRLTKAAEQVGYSHHAKAHRAIADCDITLAVCFGAANSVSKSNMIKNIAFYPAINKLDGVNLLPPEEPKTKQDDLLATIKNNHKTSGFFFWSVVLVLLVILALKIGSS